MSEKDTNTQGQKAKSFRPLTVSFVLALTTLLMGGLVSVFLAFVHRAVYAGTLVEIDTNKANTRRPGNDEELKNAITKHLTNKR